MDDKLKRDIILEHYQSPFHKGLVDNDNYIKVNGRNASCVDNIDVMVLLEDDVIIDARFDGDACAICTSAASIMIKTLIGKNITEAKDIVNNYNNMINEKEFDEDALEEAIVFVNTSKQASRIKCATIGWRGFDSILKELEEGK